MMRSWKTWAGILVSCVFLYLAAGNIDWGRFFESMRQLRLGLIFVVMAIVLSTLYLRAYRWTFFLEPLGRVPVPKLFWSTTIGFAVNNVLPARLGEVARAYSVQRTSGIPWVSAFGTIVVERLYDTFVALFLFVLAFALFDFPGIEKIFPVTQGKAALFLGAAGVIMLTGVLLLKWKTEASLGVAGFFFRPLPERFAAKMIQLFRSFIQGLTQTSDPAKILWVLFLSVAIWIISGFSVYLNVLAFGISLSYKAVIVLMLAIVFSVAIPAAPGYVGVYHFLVQQTLILYMDMDATQALSVAVVVHATNYIPQTAVGLARFAYEGLKVSELFAAGEQRDE